MSLDYLSKYGNQCPEDFEYETRCDSNLSESDLPRIQRELVHNLKKADRRER